MTHEIRDPAPSPSAPLPRRGEGRGVGCGAGHIGTGLNCPSPPCQRREILPRSRTVPSSPRDFGPIPGRDMGRDTMFHRETPEEIFPQPGPAVQKPPHPRPLSREGRGGKIGCGLGARDPGPALRSDPGYSCRAPLGLEKSGTGQVVLSRNARGFCSGDGYPRRSGRQRRAGGERDCPVGRWVGTLCFTG
jgi:hypothetical protein